MEKIYKENFKKNFKKNREIMLFSIMSLLSLLSLIGFILFFEKLDLYAALLLGTLIFLGIMVFPELISILESCFKETTETEEEKESETDSESEEANL